MPGPMSSGVRRWAAATWAVLVVTGGGVTLWLEDAAAPNDAGRHRADPSPDGVSTGDVRECPAPSRLPHLGEAGPFERACLTAWELGPGRPQAEPTEDPPSPQTGADCPPPPRPPHLGENEPLTWGCVSARRDAGPADEE